MMRITLSRRFVVLDIGLTFDHKHLLGGLVGRLELHATFFSKELGFELNKSDATVMCRDSLDITQIAVR